MKMNKRRKTNQNRIPLSWIMLVVVLANIIAFTSVGGTLARYAWSAQSLSQATVAQFAFDINDDEIRSVGSTISEFDLFSTRYLTAPANTGDDTAADGSVTVWTNEGDNVVAPGTKGQFSLLVTNQGEVTIQPTFNFSSASTGVGTIPITYSAVTVAGSTAANAGEYKELATSIVGNEIKPGESAITTVYWQWVYERGNDGADTDFGLDGQSEVSVTVQCKVDQVN